MCKGKEDRNREKQRQRSRKHQSEGRNRLSVLEEVEEDVNKSTRNKIILVMKRDNFF